MSLADVSNKANSWSFKSWLRNSVDKRSEESFDLCFIYDLKYTTREDGLSGAVTRQGCGSGSQLDPDSIGSVDPDPGEQNDPQK
jgi:hypothetical protein